MAEVLSSMGEALSPQNDDDEEEEEDDDGGDDSIV